MYFCVCVFVCVCAVRACLCVRASRWVGVGARARGCVCASRLAYPTCHVQGPYCLRPLWHHHIFRHYLINGMIFEKKNLLNIKYVFLYSLQGLFETFLILRENQRGIVINVITSSCKASVTSVAF